MYFTTQLHVCMTTMARIITYRIIQKAHANASRGSIHDIYDDINTMLQVPCVMQRAKL
jgi:hypothetical protein